MLGKVKSSELKDEQACCRAWAYEKLKVCLDKRPISATCGTLIMADSGCGKTTFCKNIVWPQNNVTQMCLSKQLLAYHFCKIDQPRTLLAAEFLVSLTQQLFEHAELSHQYRKYCPLSAHHVSLRAIGDVEEYFMSNIITPLRKMKDIKTKKTYFLLIDGLDECCLKVQDFTLTNGSVAILLAKYHKFFPTWVALVCTCSTKAKKTSKMFLGFRKITLDDSTKSHVIHDIQKYILHRIDCDNSLKHMLNKETADVLDKMHVKSNGCFLYIKLILDLVGQNSITLYQAQEIPATLYGLYVWLCQRVFSQTSLIGIIRKIFSILLASRLPISIDMLHSCLVTRNIYLTLSDVKDLLSHTNPILTVSSSEEVSFCHSSFHKWIQDIKFCSSSYYCDSKEGSEMLALYYTLHAESLTHQEVSELAFHVHRCNSLSYADIGSSPHSAFTPVSWEKKREKLSECRLDASQQAVWILLSGAQLDSSSLLVTNALSHSDISSGYTIHQDSTESSSSVPAFVMECVTKGDTSRLMKLVEEVDVNFMDSHGQIPLIAAVMKLDLQVVRKLVLDAQAEVNFPNAEMKTAMHVAAMLGCEDIVDFLLAHDADVNKMDIDGHTPLLEACQNLHTTIVERLISSGAHVNCQDNQKKTVIAAVCSQSFTDNQTNQAGRIVSNLIHAGCDINLPDINQRMPLHLSSNYGNVNLCEILMAASAIIDPVDENQMTPLLCASDQGHLEVVELLTHAGADVHHLDHNGRNGLSLACVAGHVNIVQHFLDLGQDEMHKDNYGSDCLHLTAAEGHKKIIQMLVYYGAELNSQDDQGRTPVYVATQFGHEEALNTLLMSGANPSICAHNGHTPLMVACILANKKCAQLLIEHGANVHYKDIEKRPIVYMLAVENAPDCIPLLESVGADLNARDSEGRTALHVACWQGHDDMVNCLVNLDCDIDATDNETRTPLQSAVWQGHAKIADILCRHGADVNHTCSQGATPLCIAAQEGFLDVVSVLCNYTADPNHVDKLGRTAFKIALKSNNHKLIILLENIMRRFKPKLNDVNDSHLSRDPNWQLEQLPANDIEYENYRELVSPYAVNDVVSINKYQQKWQSQSRHLCNPPQRLYNDIVAGKESVSLDDALSDVISTSSSAGNNSCFSEPDSLDNRIPSWKSKSNLKIFEPCHSDDCPKHDYTSQVSDTYQIAEQSRLYPAQTSKQDLALMNHPKSEYDLTSPSTNLMKSAAQHMIKQAKPNDSSWIIGAEILHASHSPRSVRSKHAKIIPNASPIKAKSVRSIQKDQPISTKNITTDVGNSGLDNVTKNICTDSSSLPIGTHPRPSQRETLL